MLISSAKERVLLLARNKAAVSKQGQKIFYSYFIFQVSSEKVDNRAIKEALLLWIHLLGFVLSLNFFSRLQEVDISWTFCKLRTIGSISRIVFHSLGELWMFCKIG